ncbi:MAG: oxidoreductase [Sciscionella sp.]
MPQWTEADIPDQSDRTVLITGANSGLGLRSAQVLAGKGARVLLACRSAERGEQALRQVRACGGTAELQHLDLADLESVRKAAAEIRERTGDAVDVLMNNAGVMMTPKRSTKQDYELQFGTNHLGHAALTWLLMPALRNRPGARVVTLSSLAAVSGRLNYSDPNFEHRRYTPPTAYGQAKLANQVFAIELDRRLRAADAQVRSIAAHPGFTSTELSANMGRAHGIKLIEWIGEAGNRLLAQRVERGALPQLYAATDPSVRGGEYIGPSGPGQMRGHPKPITPLAAARDAVAGARLWALTADLTKVAPDPA